MQLPCARLPVDLPDPIDRIAGTDGEIHEHERVVVAKRVGVRILPVQAGRNLRTSTAGMRVASIAAPISRRGEVRMLIVLRASCERLRNRSAAPSAVRRSASGAGRGYHSCSGAGPESVAQIAAEPNRKAVSPSAMQ